VDRKARRGAGERRLEESGGGGRFLRRVDDLPADSSIANGIPNGALTTRRIFRVTWRSSSNAGGRRLVNHRFSRSRATSRGKPYRSGAPDSNVTTPLLMFPWMSKAAA